MKVHVKSLVLPMFLLLVLTLVAGCAKKPAATTTATDETMTTEQMGQDTQAGFGENGLSESAIGDDSMSGASSAEEVQALERVHFNFDQYNLTAEAQSKLVGNANYMKENPDVKVRIEGYCDERGSDEYNLALGQRRALAAKNYLVSLGVAPERLSVISYGEELPLDPSGTEEAYAMNRRAEFKVEL